MKRASDLAVIVMRSPGRNTSSDPLWNVSMANS
jgi:hypothetical protein